MNSLDQWLIGFIAGFSSCACGLIIALILIEVTK